MTALNYTVFADYLDPREPASNRTFILSQIVSEAPSICVLSSPSDSPISPQTPFAARLAFERISCTNGTDAGSNSTEYIRTVLNDAIVPMGADVGCTSATPNPTLCLLDEFVAYQNSTAVAAANFDKACFGVNGTDFPAITGPSIRNGTVA